MGDLYTNIDRQPPPTSIPSRGYQKQTTQQPIGNFTDDPALARYHHRVIGKGAGGGFVGGINKKQRKKNDALQTRYQNAQVDGTTDYGKFHDQDSDSYAEDVYSDLIRAEYSDYEKRFKPVQDDYLDLATSTDLLDQQLGRISANTNKSYDMASLAKKHNLGRYGVTQSGEEESRNQKSNDLDASLSIANAKNSTRSHAYDRQQAMITGGAMPSIRADINTGVAKSSPVAS